MTWRHNCFQFTFCQDSFITRCSLVSLNRGVRRPSSREGTHALACSGIKNKALPLAASSGPASRRAVEWSVLERAVYRYYSCSVLERSVVSGCPVRFVIYQRRIFQSVGYISSYIMDKSRNLSLYCNVVAEQNYEIPQDRLWPYHGDTINHTCSICLNFPQRRMSPHTVHNSHKLS